MSGPRPDGDAQASEVLLKFAADDLLLFTQLVHSEIEPRRPFSYNLATQALCATLTHLADNNRPDPEEDNKAIANLPPRTGKSLIASVAYPLFVLGRDPSQKIINITYGDELTRMLAEQRRRVLASTWYRHVFPGVRLVRNTAAEITTDQGGFILGTSVGGTLTGRGGNHFILDDPIKAADVYSSAKREATNEWLQNTLASRPDDKRFARMLLVMQRLHVDDPSGVLLRTRQWYRLKLAAIAERDETIELMYGKTHQRRAGEVLNPETDPLHRLEELRETMTEPVFAAQYQQEPVPLEGGLFKVRCFQRYDRAPQQQSGDTIIQSWDTAFSEKQTSDYSVGTTWLVRRDNYYLLECVRGRFGYPDLRQAIQAARARYPAAHILVEYAGSGISVGQDLRTLGINPITIKADGDKVARAHWVTPVLEAGRIHLPARASFVEAFTTEVAAFPGNASHDDQVDSMVQAITWWEKRKLQPTTLFGSY